MEDINKPPQLLSGLIFASFNNYINIADLEYYRNQKFTHISDFQQVRVAYRKFENRKIVTASSVSKLYLSLITLKNRIQTNLT